MMLFEHRFNDRALLRLAVVTSFIQFTNALEYMVFNPVFTFMAADFAIPVSFSGYVSAIYTLGAVISGMSAFYWIGWFKQKPFLIISMALSGILTLSTTFTTSFAILLTLRFCAGLAGGTTMGVATSLLINATPVNLRGKMLATVIASFSMVSIVGMPTALYLCTHFGWHICLWSISTLYLLALPLIVSTMPTASAPSGTPGRLSLNVETLLFASSNALVQFSPMLIIPVLVPLMTQQLGVSPTLLPWLFFAGGIAGYLSTKITAVLISRFSALILATASTLIFMLCLLIPVMGYQNAPLFITLFLGASYSRLVSSSAITMPFPDDKQRAGFVSLQTALIYVFTTTAFCLSSLLLADHGLTPQNLNTLLAVCAIAASAFPALAFTLQKRLAKRLRLPVINS